MEESSVLFWKGCSPWKGLLLTSSLLTFWHLSTTADVAIESLPPQVAEGENVLFLVRGLPKNHIAFAWFKGLTNTTHGIAWYTLDNNLHGPGPVNSGRETVYRNGSLLLQNITQKDTGTYTLKIYNRRGKIISTTSIYLHDYGQVLTCGRLATSAQLSIESVPPIVAEGKSVLLLVHNPPENIVGFVWFKGMTMLKNLMVARYILGRKSTVWGPAYGGRETLYSDGSLLLHDVTPKDHGLYTLLILRSDMRSEDAQVQLQVDTSLSLSCNPLTSSQLMIQLEPRYAAEGEDVIFQVHNPPEDMQAFSWQKSKYRTEFLKIVEYSRAMNFLSWGPAHRGRGMLYNNGSMMLRNVTEKDAGTYTLSVINKDAKIEKAYVELDVKKYVSQPFVQISDTTVTGRRSVIFTCISPDSNVSIRWIFNNKNLKLTERMTLSPTKCGLRIYPAGFENAGEYKSFIWNSGHHATSAQFRIESVPPIVTEGKSVLLLVHNPPENIVAFVWFKRMTVFKKCVVARYVLGRKSTVWGPAYSGRETLYSDGSLLLRGVTLKDRGLYTLEILRRDMRCEDVQVQLQVHTSFSLFCNPLTSSQLMIQLEPQYAAEGEDVLFQVQNLSEDIQAFSWYKSKYGTEVLKIVQYNRAMNSISWGTAHRTRGMVYNNGSMMLRDVTEKDAGMYTIEVSKKDSKIEKAYVEFYVKQYVSQPFVQINDTTAEGHRSVIFTCISPDPDVSIRWIFNNQILKQTERITLSPTKHALRIYPVRNEDAGEYKCEVSNQFSLKTSLPVSWPR
ncbi:pregnancy-specific glycoprotein 22-like [Onychomys torridus]|uniref:pregnancy-specific glycoprotein 22-like n=1 Tax=Onychomys torridus TaxID=38674 RepID=UPI00167F8588|nr:pregnancy-specific glycoprotein 22-like [Onychomys torridus]